MEQVAFSSQTTKSQAVEKYPQTAEESSGRRNSDRCCAGPGEIDSILYIFAYFSSFF